MSQSPQPASPSLLASLEVVPGIPWFHLSDPASSKLDELATHFGIHPLQIEDCRHRRQTARLEDHERYTFIVIKALAGGHSERAAGFDGQQARRPSGGSTQGPAAEGPISGGVRLRFEDFDIFLGPDYVLTMDEGRCTLVSSLATRVAAEPALQNPDRIAHALIDSAVDQYLPALDRLGDWIDRLEDRVLTRPAPATLREIFRLKRVLLDFHRVATAMREAVNRLVRRDDALPSGTRPADRELRLYYRDVYDHLVRIIDSVEVYRDLLTGSLDIYLSAVANRTNQVMKILTIWGTIALPMVIVTSYYGMNVKLPFQDYPHILLVQAGLMLGSSLAILYYFWRKHWF
jgi:magnesium transporter